MTESANQERNKRTYFENDTFEIDDNAEEMFLEDASDSDYELTSDDAGCFEGSNESDSGLIMSGDEDENINHSNTHNDNLQVHEIM